MKPLSGRSRLLRLLPVILIPLLVLGIIVPTIAAGGLFTFKGNDSAAAASAAEEWDMASGWTDFSTPGNIAFQNNSEQAGYATYRKPIDGSAGFRLSLRLDFPETELLSSARILLYSPAQYNHFFELRVYGQNGGAGINAGFNKGGVWAAPIISDTGLLAGAQGSVRLYFEREQNSPYISIFLKNLQGQTLYECKTKDDVYAGQRFLDEGNLTLAISSLEGGNCFRVSEFALTSYPDDGIPDGQSAQALWTMPQGWTAETLEDGTLKLLGGSTQNANWYKPSFRADRDFRVSFVVTPLEEKETALVLTLSTPSVSPYLFLRLNNKPEQGAHLAAEEIAVNLGAEQSYAWKSLGALDWNWAGSSYRFTLEWEHESRKLRLTRSTAEGGGDTILSTKEFDLPAIEGSNTLFDIFGEKELLFTMAGSGSLLSVTDFSLESSRQAAQDWSMPQGWTDCSTVDEMVFNGGIGADENELLMPLDALHGFDISYTLAFADTGSAMETILNGPGQEKLKLLATGSSSKVSLQALYEGKESGRTLSQSPELSVTDAQVLVRLQRQAGSSQLKVKLESTAGETLWHTELTDSALTAQGFYDCAAVTVSLLPLNGTSTVKGFATAEYPRQAAEQSEYDLGKGWTAYRDDAGLLYLTKTNGDENEAVLRRSLDGKLGFKVQYDITFCTPQLTTTYVKLGILGDDERFFFSRIKGQDGSVWAEGQVYNNGSWSGKLLSADASERKQTGGTVRVLLERQQGSDSLHYCLSLPDGTVLMDETIQNSVLDLSLLNNEHVRFMIGRDSDASSFIIRNVQAVTYPAQLPSLTGLDILGQDSCRVGEQLVLCAGLTPSDSAAMQYSWLVDGTHTGVTDSLTLVFGEEGTHTVVLQVTDCKGNTLSKTLSLYVYPVPAGAGDVNLDGSVTRQDAELLLDYCAGSAELSNEQLTLADVNADGEIDIADAQRLLWKLEGMR